MTTKAPKPEASSSDHNVMVVEMFREDPEFAAEYLNSVLEDGDQAELLLAMRRMAEAFGGVPELAKKTKLHAKTLYRTLSAQGNPEMKSLTAILQAMGLRITVAPIKSPLKPARRQAIEKTA